MLRIDLPKDAWPILPRWRIDDDSGQRVTGTAQRESASFKVSVRNYMMETASG